MMWNYGPHWGMMGGWGYGSYGAFDMLLWPIILIAVIVGVVWFMRKDGSQGIQFMPRRRSTGLDVLEERFARGEIGRDEYVEKKRDIEG